MENKNNKGKKLVGVGAALIILGFSGFFFSIIFQASFTICGIFFFLIFAGIVFTSATGIATSSRALSQNKDKIKQTISSSLSRVAHIFGEEEEKKEEPVYCEYCGTRIPEGETFCQACGAPRKKQ